ncbi:MAG: class I SAM-dependent methyltransferase [Candidatus Kaelpia imicola]|nr:class I SAM-dependent methyltransferase [Candidatus Kaelpia imicola]
MHKEKRDFDKEAAFWDDNPVRLKLRDDLFDVLSSHIVLRSDMDILDFGCGTGLFTLKLQPFVRSIVGVDSSEGMLNVLNSKIEREGIKNTKTLCFDIEAEGILRGEYDLIVTNMTLHHIEDVGSLLVKFYRLLKSPGYLCISDLDKEDGRYHNNQDGLFHYGFDRENLKGLLKEVSFCDVYDTTAAKVVKPDDRGKMGKFSLFLIIAKKVQ